MKNSVRNHIVFSSLLWENIFVSSFHLNTIISIQYSFFDDVSLGSEFTFDDKVGDSDRYLGQSVTQEVTSLRWS